MVNKIESIAKEAPFVFDYVEKLLRTKNFGILSTMTSKGRPHSVGVVYALSPRGQPFSIYLISRVSLKKVRNINDNPNISFAVPFPHYIFRMIPPSCIQFQGKAELIPFDDPTALKAFQRSIVLRRSIMHNLSLGGENTFIKIVPDNKIYSFGIGNSILHFISKSQNKKLRNYYVIAPAYRRNQG